MKRYFPILAILILLSIVPALGASVKTDYDPAYDFSKIRTFVIKEPRRVEGNFRQSSPLVINRVCAALESQLVGLGYEHREGGPADIQVHFYTSNRQRTEVENYGWGMPPRWRWGWGSTVWVRHYTVGSIVVDILDVQAKQLVWRGVVSDTVRTGPEKSEKQINSNLEKLFNRYRKDIHKR